MKLCIPILLFFLIYVSAFGQKPAIINHQALHFQLKSKKDTIDFIVIDTLLNQKKPVFLFCQGSMPIPLFVDSPKYGKFMIGGGVTNFDVEEIKKYYHLVIISMPKTPLIVEEKNLNNSYAFIPDSTKPQEISTAFQKVDYAEYYERRAEKVIKFLRRQGWVDNSKLVVAGHSQGSKIAVKIALKNKNVTHVGLFGANPFGRVDQMVRQARKDAEQHKISWDEADKKIEDNYSMYKAANNDADTNPGLIAWKSFSEPMIDKWLTIKIPVYLAYGTADITSDLCDLVPLYFIRAQKENLTYKRYPGLEHNFFELKEDGRPNYEKGHWAEVMSAFVQWTNKKTGR